MTGLGVAGRLEGSFHFVACIELQSLLKSLFATTRHTVLATVSRCFLFDWITESHARTAQTTGFRSKSGMTGWGWRVGFGVVLLCRIQRVSN